MLWGHIQWHHFFTVTGHQQSLHNLSMPSRCSVDPLLACHSWTFWVFQVLFCCLFGTVTMLDGILCCLFGVHVLAIIAVSFWGWLPSFSSRLSILSPHCWFIFPCDSQYPTLPSVVCSFQPFHIHNCHVPCFSSVSHTHTTQPFYGSVEFVRENPGEPVPEETFTHYSHRSHQLSLSAFSI